MEPVIERSLNGGTQKIYRFANNYGASLIIGGQFAYGGLEIAVLHFEGEGSDEYDLDYSTPITDDVLGNLSVDDVPVILEQIEALPERK